MKLKMTQEGRYYSERNGVTEQGKIWKIWTTRTIWKEKLVFCIHVNYKNKFGSTTFNHIRECNDYLSRF